MSTDSTLAERMALQDGDIEWVKHPDDVSTKKQFAAEQFKAGNEQSLINWFENDSGIAWGEDGSFRACLAEAGKHMDDETAAGFCANRYHAVTGEWPGAHHKKSERLNGTAEHFHLALKDDLGQATDLEKARLRELDAWENFAHKKRARPFEVKVLDPEIAKAVVENLASKPAGVSMFVWQREVFATARKLVTEQA